MTITIFLADDHPLIMEGLQLILENQPDLKVIGQALTGRELVRGAAKQQPDVAIVDVAMPELNGIEAVRQLREQCPHCRVIMLSMQGTARQVMRAIEAGASGYLLKESAQEEVIRAVRSVVQGRRYFSQKIANLISEDPVPRPQVEKIKDPMLRLSSREREVLELVVEGYTNAKIAEMLHLSPKTIATYRSRIMQKLNQPNLASLIRFTLEQDLTPRS